MRAIRAEPADPSATELWRAAISLERRLSQRVRAFEERYELRSVELEAALRAGSIRETAEIAEWVVAHGTLTSLADELQARSE